MTQPTPEQLAKWREEATSFYMRTPINPDRLGHSHFYIDGYLRARQENEQALREIYHRTYPSIEAQLAAIKDLFK